MSVCGSWNSLITSNYFVLTHLTYQKALSNDNITYRLCYTHVYANEPYKFSAFCDDGFTFRQLCEYVGPNSSSTWCFVGCCDGMVCLNNINLQTGRKWFILWNPSQRKYIEVDSTPTYVEHVPDGYGFGVDAYSNDYKVVVLVIESHGDKGISYGCYVYSLRRGSWNYQHLPYSPIWIIPSGTHLEGVIHWKMVKPCASGGGVRLYSILTFNLADETFDQITFPEVLIISTFHKPLTVKWHGKDCIAVLLTDVKQRCKYLWVLEKYGIVESWRRVAKFKLDTFMVHLHDVRTNGEILVTTQKYVLGSIDPKTEKFKLISSEHIYHAGTYVESLVSLLREEKD